MDINKLKNLFKGKRKTENLVILLVLVILVVVAINYIWKDDIKNTNIEEVVNLCKVLVNQYGTAISDQTVIVALKAKGWI